MASPATHQSRAYLRLHPTGHLPALSALGTILQYAAISVPQCCKPLVRNQSGGVCTADAGQAFGHHPAADSFKSGDDMSLTPVAQTALEGTASAMCSANC